MPKRAHSDTRQPAPKRQTAQQIRGQQTEQLACAYLQASGLSLVARNYRSRFGEIDLIMENEHCLVFVEVRYRKHQQFGGAAASISVSKQQRLIRTALAYLQHAKSQKPARFDVIAVDAQQRINWIQQAFHA